MISRRRMSAVLEPAPSFVVTVCELLNCSFLVRKVTSGKDLSRDFCDQLGRSLRARQVRAARDVPRSHQDVGFRHGWRLLRTLGLMVLSFSSRRNDGENEKTWYEARDAMGCWQASALRSSFAFRIHFRQACDRNHFRSPTTVLPLIRIPQGLQIHMADLTYYK